MTKSFFPDGAAGGISGGVYQACPERSYFISLKLNGSPFRRFCSCFQVRTLYNQKFKSDGQEKSTKILISLQELTGQFLSFFVDRYLLSTCR